MIKYSLLIVFCFMITNTIYSQTDCDGCKGNNPDWKPERVIITPETANQSPYNSIIKIVVKRWYNFSPHYGTGSFINDSIIITAHHNVIRKGAITYINYTVNGKTIELDKKDFEVYYYRKNYNTQTDVALIKITNPAKIEKVNTHFIPTDIKETFDASANLTGYPCDYQGNALLNKMTNLLKATINKEKSIIAYPLYTCTGDSGAPLWVKEGENYHVIGIHHGGNEGLIPDSDYNISVLLNEGILKWIQSIR